MMALSFILLAAVWSVIAGRINLLYYTSQKQPYFMQHVSGFGALLLWVGFVVALSRLAANSFSPFLYFQF